jgi:hypothetical protein
MPVISGAQAEVIAVSDQERRPIPVDYGDLKLVFAGGRERAKFDNPLFFPIFKT